MSIALTFSQNYMMPVTVNRRTHGFRYGIERGDCINGSIAVSSVGNNCLSSSSA